MSSRPFGLFPPPFTFGFLRSRLVSLPPLLPHPPCRLPSSIQRGKKFSRRLIHAFLAPSPSILVAVSLFLSDPNTFLATVYRRRVINRAELFASDSSPSFSSLFFVVFLFSPRACFNQLHCPPSLFFSLPLPHVSLKPLRHGGPRSGSGLDH